MTRISSRWTFFYKRVFPMLWFGFLALFAGGGVVGLLTGKAAESVPLLVVPLVMALLGYFIMRTLVWDLVDEVYDCGDSLLIKDRGAEGFVRLSNVMNVNATTAVNPPRITLRLIEPGPLGAEITFSPVVGFQLNPFAKSRVAEDLIERVHRARSARAV